MFIDEPTDDVDLTTRSARVVQTGWYDCEVIDAEVIQDKQGRNKLQVKFQCTSGPTQHSPTPDGGEEEWDPAACINDRDTGELRGIRWVDWIPLPPYAPKGEDPAPGEYRDGAKYYLARFKAALGYDQSEGFDSSSITGLPVRLKVGRFTRDSQNRPLDEPENRISDYDTSAQAA